MHQQAGGEGKQDSRDGEQDGGNFGNAQGRGINHGFWWNLAELRALIRFEKGLWLTVGVAGQRDPSFVAEGKRIVVPIIRQIAPFGAGSLVPFRARRARRAGHRAVWLWQRG